MDNMYDFNAELLAKEANSNAFQFVANQLGIIVLENGLDDEIIAVWIYQRKQPDGSFVYQQICCKSHSCSAAIVGVLKAIHELGTYNNLTIRLIGYDRAKKIVRNKMYPSQET